MIQKVLRYIILVLIIITLSIADLYSQDKGAVIAYGKLKVEWGNLDNTKIILYQDGTQMDKFYPAENGKFQFTLLLNHQYLFWFEKPGYVTKKVDFNTSVPAEVTSNPEFEPFPDFDFYVTLFKTYPDVDTMFFANPVGKIKYDSKLNDFDYDKEYKLEIQRHMDEIEEQIKQKHEKEVKEIELETKTPVKEDKKEEVVPTEEPVAKKEEKKPDISSQESVAQTIKQEEPVPTEVPKTIILESNDVTSKKNIPEVVEAEKVNPKPQVSFISKVPQAEPTSTEIGGKKVTRTPISYKDVTLVYIKVEYKWGGRFFFIEDEPNQYRNISEVYYNLMIEKKQ